MSIQTHSRSAGRGRPPILHSLATALFALVCSGDLAQSAADDEPDRTKAPPDGLVVHVLCRELTGEWSAVRDRGCWSEMGIEPSGLTWHDDIDDRGPRVIAEPRYRDVDEDGLADAFIALYDGAVVHWMFAHATMPGRWAQPAYLGRAEYTPNSSWQDWRQPDGSVARPRDRVWPASMTVGGRALMTVNTGTGTGVASGHLEVLFEIVDDTVVEVFRDTLHRGREWLRGDRGVQTGRPGDVLLYTPRSVALLLRAGEHEAALVEVPDDEELRALRLAQPDPGPPGEHLHELHPTRVAYALTGLPRDVVANPIWEHIGVDPSGYRFQQDMWIQPGSDEARIWKIASSVAYDDFDDDGLPDAFVLMHQGFGNHWVVLEQAEPGVWTCPGFLGPLWIEHGIADRLNNPPKPATSRINGRTFIAARTGSIMDMDLEIHRELYLFEGGSLHALLDEVMSKKVAEQQAELRPADNGAVELVVRTWTYPRERAGKDEPGRVRVWTLPAGSQMLELVSDTCRESE